MVNDSFGGELVLSPPLWNVVYNRVFVLVDPEDVSIISYAEDVTSDTVLGGKD